MADAFTARGLSPIAQLPVTYYTVDFAFPRERLVVECDGDYWHGTIHQRRRDRAKDTYLIRHGWRVLRLTETEIKASASQCVERVLAMLHADSSL